MAEADRTLGMYLHLARASGLRRQPMVRDKLLILAGVQAEQMGLEPISALCRHRILAHNARHLVRSWPTMTAALADEHFRSYLKQLNRRYSREKIEHMVHSLGIELAHEREAYFDDLEYAAALLDTRPDSIAEILAVDPREVSRRNRVHRTVATGAANRDRARTSAALKRMLNLPVIWVRGLWSRWRHRA